MIDIEQPYTPSLDEGRSRYATVHGTRRISPHLEAEFDHMIEAVRAEEREQYMRLWGAAVEHAEQMERERDDWRERYENRLVQSVLETEREVQEARDEEREGSRVMKITDEMVERAARAIYASENPDRTWILLGLGAQRRYRKQARAALEAALLGVKPTPEDDHEGHEFCDPRLGCVLPEADAEWEWAGGYANFDGQWAADGEHYDNRDDAEFEVEEARAARIRSTLVRRRKPGPWEPVPENGDDA